MSERKRSRHEPAQSKARCPICANPVSADYRPFCSARCADVDLGRWLKGTYSISTEEAPDDGAHVADPSPGPSPDPSPDADD